MTSVEEWTVTFPFLLQTCFKQNKCLLTSDKNVCALFCAPTCNKYSYTYSANLKYRGKVYK